MSVASRSPKDMVQATAPEPRPILYSFRRCPYAMRARLALAGSGIACSLREVVLRDKPQALREASPKATVPVLVLANGQVLEQSLDIMLWALGRNDPLGWLVPERGDRAAMLALIAGCDEVFKGHLDRYKYPQRYGNADGLVYREQGARWLDTLEQAFGDDDFLFGQRAALADMAIAPFVRQFAYVDVDWFQAQPWPRIKVWLDAWMASVLFERVMRKYAAWAPGDEGEDFPD